MPSRMRTWQAGSPLYGAPEKNTGKDADMAGWKPAPRVLIIAVMARPITLIPGDGIGPEVADAAVLAVEAAGAEVEWDRVEAGARALAEQGQLIPDDVYASLEVTRVGLKGPTATPIGGGPPEHQRGAAQETGPVCQLSAGENASRPEDALPGRAAGPGHFPREHRRPLRRTGTRSGSGGGGEPQNHHPDRLLEDCAGHLRIRAPGRPAQGHGHPQGQHHEVERRPVPGMLPRDGGAGSPRPRTTS